MQYQPVVAQPRPVHRSFRLTRPGQPVAVASQVRPSLVLEERQARALLAAAQRGDVSRGGCFAAGPAGVQVWSRPWDGARPGDAELLGSVDWSYDTPTKHWITVYRVMITAPGVAAGLTAEDVLSRVLALAGMTPADAATSAAPAARGGLPVPPPRDPFRAAARREVDLSGH